MSAKLNTAQATAEVLKTLRERANVFSGPLWAVQINADKAKGNVQNIRAPSPEDLPKLPSAVIIAQANAIASGLNAEQDEKDAAGWAATRQFMAQYRDTLLEKVKGWPQGEENVKRFATAATAAEQPERPGLSDLLPRTTDIAEGVGNVLSDVRTTAYTVAVAVGLVALLVFLPQIKAALKSK